MKQRFFETVDLRNKKAMISFLSGHFRYSTMNSWNGCDSYANNMKIHRVIPSEFTDKVFEMLESEDFYDDVNSVIGAWDRENNFEYQAGFNGRSSGYLVMYQGYVEEKMIFKFEKDTEQYHGRDYADGYGWMDKEEAIERGLYRKMTYRVHTKNTGVDDGAYYEDWDMVSLRDRVKLVQSFDKLCDDVVDCVLLMCATCKVDEEEYTVTKTRKVINCF